MANTFDLIESKIISTASNVSFTNLPTTYDDLCFHISARTTRNATSDTILFRLNNDSGTNYVYKQMYAYDGGVGGYENSSGYTAMFSQCLSANGSANAFNVGWYYLPQYRNTSYWKDIIGDSGYPSDTGAAWQLDLWAATWKNTSAVTSLDFFGGISDNIAVGTIISLYGIKYTA
jgi:hypothetical protein